MERGALPGSKVIGTRPVMAAGVSVSLAEIRMTGLPSQAAGQVVIDMMGGITVLPVTRAGVKRTIKASARALVIMIVRMIAQFLVIVRVTVQASLVPTVVRMTVLAMVVLITVRMTARRLTTDKIVRALGARVIALALAADRMIVQLMVKDLVIAEGIVRMTKKVVVEVSALTNRTNQERAPRLKTLCDRLVMPAPVCRLAMKLRLTVVRNKPLHPPAPQDLLGK